MDGAGSGRSRKHLRRRVGQVCGHVQAERLLRLREKAQVQRGDVHPLRGEPATRSASVAIPVFMSLRSAMPEKPHFWVNVELDGSPSRRATARRRRSAPRRRDPRTPRARSPRQRERRRTVLASNPPEERQPAAVRSPNRTAFSSFAPPVSAACNRLGVQHGPSRDDGPLPSGATETVTDPVDLAPRGDNHQHRHQQSQPPHQPSLSARADTEHRQPWRDRTRTRSHRRRFAPAA